MSFDPRYSYFKVILNYVIISDTDKVVTLSTFHKSLIEFGLLGVVGMNMKLRFMSQRPSPCCEVSGVRWVVEFLWSRQDLPAEVSFKI